VGADAREVDDKRPGLFHASPQLSAEDVLARAYDAAGGETWLSPKTLLMTGYGVFYKEGAFSVQDDYRMWRVFPKQKGDAHAADGKVRIEGRAGGALALLIAFDGKTTYGPDGAMPDQTANAQWAENFGFGAIRFAMNEGWLRKRLPDDFIDGELAFLIELKDPAGGVTRFGIGQNDYRILSVAFDTPRGWHERRYSDFFTKPGSTWLQPGRVRLFYDGVKQNEIIWTDFILNAPMDDSLFVVRALR
jgi:hypothetical protein